MHYCMVGVKRKINIMRIETLANIILYNGLIGILCIAIIGLILVAIYVKTKWEILARVISALITIESCSLGVMIVSTIISIILKVIK